MRAPRDLSGLDRARALRKLGYDITRRAGSRLTTQRNGEHHPCRTTNLFESARSMGFSPPSRGTTA